MSTKCSHELIVLKLFLGDGGRLRSQLTLDVDGMRIRARYSCAAIGDHKWTLS